MLPLNVLAIFLANILAKAVKKDLFGFFVVGYSKTEHRWGGNDLVSGGIHACFLKLLADMSISLWFHLISNFWLLHENDDYGRGRVMWTRLFSQRRTKRQIFFQVAGTSHIGNLETSWSGRNTRANRKRNDFPQLIAFESMNMFMNLKK